jgi:hypothetical protein
MLISRYGLSTTCDSLWLLVLASAWHIVVYIKTDVADRRPGNTNVVLGNLYFRTNLNIELWWYENAMKGTMVLIKETVEFKIPT